MPFWHVIVGLVFQDSTGLGPDWAGFEWACTRMAGPEWVGLDWVGPDRHGTVDNIPRVVSRVSAP